MDDNDKSRLRRLSWHGHARLMLRQQEAREQRERGRVPLVMGGQGRTARSLRDDASSFWFTVAAVLLVLALLILREARK